MKKIFEDIKFEVVTFDTEDVIRTSSCDNVEPMPDFPETFGG